MYGFDCVGADDPYAAMVELCAKKSVYNAVILSLVSLFREELTAIATIKRRFPHLEVWLTHTDGRQADLAEAMRLGADGLLSEEGLHRIAPLPPPSADTQIYAPSPVPNQAGEPVDSRTIDQAASGETVLSADELRALLQDQPAMPPAGNPPET
jgi:hypothetical protein